MKLNQKALTAGRLMAAGLMKKVLMASFVASLVGVASTASAHLVAFGWKDNGNGTITMFGEHWHGDQSAPSTANGGVRIGVYGTDPTLWPVFQWTGYFNNQGGVRDLLLAGRDERHHGAQLLANVLDRVLLAGLAQLAGPSSTSRVRPGSVRARWT